MDGLTTNGVLIMHPHGCFSDGNATYGTWREVSIGGAIYSLRASRSAPVKGNAVSRYINYAIVPLYRCTPNASSINGIRVFEQNS